MKHLSKGRDRRIFANTAKRTRALNLGRVVARGGIRM